MCVPSSPQALQGSPNIKSDKDTAKAKANFLHLNKKIDSQHSASSREKKANECQFYFHSRRSFRGIAVAILPPARRWGDEPYFGFACRLLPQALVRTEALDTDPLPTTDHDLPLGLLRVANWMVASRLGTSWFLILIVNLTGTATQAGAWSDARSSFDSGKYDLQHCDTSFVLITCLRCRTGTTATVLKNLS